MQSPLVVRPEVVDPDGDFVRRALLCPDQLLASIKGGEWELIQEKEKVVKSSLSDHGSALSQDADVGEVVS